MKPVSGRLRTAVALGALACGGDGTGPDNGGGGEVPGQVTVGDNFFRPGTTTLPRAGGGVTVSWSWAGGNQHNVTFDAGGPNSATQTSGSFSRTFTEAGNFTYICTIHGRAVMSGTVAVQ
ncbi:MAG: hypothetical protein H0X07_04575 [Gemmatimonadales bacterium]|nr:hypothetical protein [Gemmatimonadales bacterium]